MASVKFNITVSGKDDAECKDKMKAIATIAGNLSKAELERLAFIIKNDPKTMQLARNFLNG